MRIQVRVNSWYECYTTEEEDKKIRAYAEENGVTLEQAAYQLDLVNEINLMGSADEIDWGLADVEECEEDFEQDYCISCEVDCAHEPCPFCDNN